MEGIKELKDEIERIKARNKKVEADKAWETSLLRRIAIALSTYLVVLLFFLMTKNKKPFTDAIVPALGFLLSTFSIDILKSLWIKSRK